jgi:membrane-bound lytic murein transglycosylase D
LNLAENPVWDINVADYATHPRVQYFLDYFTGKGRDRFQVWLGRMAQFEPFVRQRLTEHQLPGDLVYLALIESGFSTEAVSRAKAVGMWQFMAATGRGYGLHVDSWVDERRDPIHATDAAARHLADLTARFGSPYLAAAAYNAGAGKVQRSLGQMNATYTESDSLDLSSDDAFFSLADTRLLKAETKDYVPKLIAAALIAKEPAKYGFDPVDGVEPFSLDSVIVEGGTGLDLIARLADTTLDALHALNPNLLRMVTPPDRDYVVRVPAGTADRVASRYSELPESARHAIAFHTVKSGETLAAVAKRYGVKPELIRLANRNVTTRLPVGKSILIPLTTELSASALRETASAATGSASTTHVVKSGETVSSIAKRYGTSITAIRLDNHLTTKSVLKVGQRLAIRGSTSRSSGARAVATTARSKSRTAAPKTVATTHVVKRGETISLIAATFGVAQSKLLSANGLSRTATIKAGQKLKIPPS